jgi:ATP-dependent Clp protease ATP-binding subunit ClpC
MFERYTEKARRIIFFARYEASQFGSPYIETEHLLLGLLREDKTLTNRFLRSHASVESIRKQIEGHTTIREKVSTSVDLPLSNECKRVLAYAAEEAEGLSHKHISTEHLLLGLLREEKCFAAAILHERGLRISTVREELARTPHEFAKQFAKPDAGGSSPLSAFSRDLTREAMDNQLDPLIGREEELEAIIQILCNRKTNNPLLVGERGVGKTAIVHGLAQRIADGKVPSFLADTRIFAFDLSLIAKISRQLEQGLAIMKELTASQNAIIFIEDLRTLVGVGAVTSMLDAGDILKPALSRGDVQCISETTPTDYPELITKTPWLGGCSRVVNVRPVNESDAVKILFGIKDRYEKFHGVTYADDAIAFAVSYSNRYLPDRCLPAKAVDVLDEAGSRVKLRQTALPEDITQVQKRIKSIVHNMENAIVNHLFEKARSYSDEERKERENLRALREKYHLDESSTGIVGREDIEDVISRWTGVSIAP